MPVVEGMTRVQGFPPTLNMVRDGIAGFRNARGLETRGVYPYKTMERVLVGREFTASGKTYRIKGVKVHEIAGPIGAVGDVEGMHELAVPSIAAAIAAYPFLGSGKKTEADAAATQAMREAMDRIHMAGTIKGGEGGGRDEMGREAALYLLEPVGTGRGLKVDFLVDPLEVTNQAKALKLGAGEFQGGEGWNLSLLDPTQWYPGYSGALSLMAAVNASDNARFGGVRPLTDDLYLNKMFFPWTVQNKGLNLNSTAEAIVRAIAETSGVKPEEIVAAGLGRSRHTSTFNNWMAAGILDANIHKPTDGDSMFAFALGSNVLQLAGLTGGVMEGVIGGMAGVPFGIQSTFQFASHSKLGEEKANADLLNVDHRFGFSEKERDAMIASNLYDGEHIGSTLRRLCRTDALRARILNAAGAERDTPGFLQESFLKEMGIIENTDERIRQGARFSEPSRAFLTKILEREGWWDVRKIARLSDFRFSRDSQYIVTSLTPNKWAPLREIRWENGRIITESMFVGGNSQTVFILESELEEVAA